MRQQISICPETEDGEEAEKSERIADPHGENLRWSKRNMQWLTARRTSEAAFGRPQSFWIARKGVLADNAAQAPKHCKPK